jgi:hypothetical protein
MVGAWPALAGRRVCARLAVLASLGAWAHVAPAQGLVHLPSLTPVPLVLDAAISSNTNQNGDRFPIHVAEDVVIDGVVVIPVGSKGEGEVVHAARSRAGGKPGELILAARYVNAWGREIRLRSFTAGAGTDRSGAALAVGVLAGPAGFLVRGGAYVLPVGMLGTAKTSEDIDLAPPAMTSSLSLQPIDDPRSSAIQ